MTTELTTTNVKLPVVDEFMAQMLDAITYSLGRIRDVLATNAQIQNARQIVSRP